MKKVEQVPFLVIGGGIGGLATALGVVEHGHKVTVLEQASKFGELGAGLQLGPNAMAVLDRFGLLGRIADFAVYPKRLVLKDAITGKELSALDLGEEFRERYGYPYAVMHRADLHTVLLEACQANDAITLLNNKAVTTVEHEDNCEKVTCDDGTIYLAEAVVGADGLWSKTRKVLVDDEAVCSEYVAYRGTIPIHEISSNPDLDDVIMWHGPNLHLVQYPVRRKELYNQVAVFKTYEYKEGTDDWGTPEELNKRFGNCFPAVRNAINFINKDFRWPMYDRLPLDNWTSGQITLMGDAAHPMLQYLAQGACQALEDAACLSDQLKIHGKNTNEAFLAYQEKRIPRTSKVQTSARLWGETLHAEDPIAIFLRNKMFDRSSQDYTASDWIYGYQREMVEQ